MDKLIANLSDHYIVCGYGRMGQQIIKDFVRQNVPHVVIEDNPIQIPKLIEQEVPFVDGKATDDKILVKAGIGRAKGLISVAATDEENVFITLTARELNPKLVIVARSILEENQTKLLRAGATKVVSPYILGGRRLSAAILKPKVVDFLELAIHTENMDLEMREYFVSETSSIAGKSVRDSGIRQASGVIILAVRRSTGEMVANPDPELIIESGDEMIVMGKPAQLDAAEKLANGKVSE